MLTQKTWKGEAVLRLALGVVICICAGSLVLSGLHYVQVKGWVFSWFVPVAAGGLFCLVMSLVRLWNPWRMERMFSPLLVFLMWLYVGLTLTFLAEKMAGPSGGEAGQEIGGMRKFEGAARCFFLAFFRWRPGRCCGAAGPERSGRLSPAGLCT